MSGSVIVLTGPPGAGKTTIARSLAESFPLGVHLHADDPFHWIVSGYVLPWTPDAHEQNTTVQDVIAAASARYAAGGYTVVVDGIVGPWFLEPLRRACGAVGASLSYVVLRPTLDVAVGRATTRSDLPFPDEGPVRKMHDEFADLGPYEHHVIDSSDLDPASTLAEVQRLLSSGALTLDQSSL